LKKKSDDHRNTKNKSESDHKPIKTREVKVNKNHKQNEPFPNLLITVPMKAESHMPEPPPKKRKISPERKNQHSDEGEQKQIKIASKEDPQIPKPTPTETGTKQKVRCVYFPACTKQNCPFFHPTEPCKNPLVCTFGPTMCRYIHPVCKFGPRCTRPDCVYTHPRESLIDCRNGYSCTQKESCIYRHPAEACNFNPKCRNQVCTYSHAPLCQYGVNCSAPGCTYAHKSVLPPTILPNDETIEVISASLPQTPPKTEEQPPQPNEVQS